MRFGRNDPGVNRHRIEELKGTVMVPVSGPTGASDWVSPIRKVTGSEQSMRPFPLKSVHPSNVMAKLCSPQTGKGRSRQRHRNVFRILKGSFSFRLPCFEIRRHEDEKLHARRHSDDRFDVCGLPNDVRRGARELIGH